MAFDLDPEKKTAETASEEEAIVDVEQRPQTEQEQVEQAPAQAEQEASVEEQTSTVEDVPQVEQDQPATEQSQAEQAPAGEVAPQVEQASAPVKDEVTKALEKLLSEDVKEIYKGLPDHLKLTFGPKGEETATKIKVMLESGRIRSDKMAEMIGEWLKMLPDAGSNLNPYYKSLVKDIVQDVLAYWTKEQGEVAPDQNQI